MKMISIFYVKNRNRRLAIDRGKLESVVLNYSRGGGTFFLGRFMNIRMATMVSGTVPRGARFCPFRRIGVMYTHIYIRLSYPH